MHAPVDGACRWRRSYLASTYTATVELDGTLREQIAVNCIAIPSMSCMPASLHNYIPDSGLVMKTPPAVSCG